MLLQGGAPTPTIAVMDRSYKYSQVITRNRRLGNAHGNQGIGG